MSYVANQYNYATPLSSAAGLLQPDHSVADKKYFCLFDNVLDGSYSPISDDVGLWSASLSDADGILSVPFTVTVNVIALVRALHIIGSAYSYPVDFTIDFFNEDIKLTSLVVENNSEASYMAVLPKDLSITSYSITMTKISSANSVARLYSLKDAVYVGATDTLKVAQHTRSFIGSTKYSIDILHIGIAEDTAKVLNIFEPSNDTLLIAETNKSTLTNVHTRMKEPYRRIYGKVYITYTDPMLDGSTTITTNSSAYNSAEYQLADAITESNLLYFTLYDNDLSGRYAVANASTQVGWVSGFISDADGYFAEAPYVLMTFESRPLIGLTVHFDAFRDNYAVDFDVTITREDAEDITYSVIGNADSSAVVTTESLSNVTSIKVVIHKISKPFSPAIVTEIPVASTLLYKGYKDASDIMSIDLLEELTYEDDIEALGGVSANEITVVLDNSSEVFYFNNDTSLVSKQLKRNRKIVPYLGVEVIPGEIEWYSLGTFWSYKWNVPVNSLTATVVGFDTIGLLGLSNFTDHQVLVGMSIGELIEYVLNDAKKMLSFIEYRIDASLYDVVIPYAWFEASNHAAALRKISMCYPMHIYCDRQGRICAAPQKLRLDYYYDTWSDNTNIVDKTYSSLYTVLPNVVNVAVRNISVVDNYNMAQDTAAFTVDGTYEKTINFSAPCLANALVLVDCDNTIRYTYTAYSWGAIIVFTGTGTVRSVSCTGTIVDATNSSVVSRSDEESVRINGAVTRDISSDFIQTIDLAGIIIDRLFSLSENDKYDASVNYRGDIALSINDPIHLLNGIAPDNRYNIRRHQLSWNGALTGSAELNT